MLLRTQAFFAQLLAAYHGLPLQSEKAKSALFIAPVLNEVRLQNHQKMTFLGLSIQGS